jgi:hypothetical protein
MMDNEKFDPNNFRIEDLFRAKERRRKELAKLSFEEKIEIAKRLQTVVIEIQRNRRTNKLEK